MRPRIGDDADDLDLGPLHVANAHGLSDRIDAGEVPVRKRLVDNRRCRRLLCEWKEIAARSQLHANHAKEAVADAIADDVFLVAAAWYDDRHVALANSVRRRLDERDGVDAGRGGQLLTDSLGGRHSLG